MYNPNKPKKYHIKTFGVCNHYLLRPLGAGHHVFVDRYYTTYNLITYLSSKNTYYTGTLQSNRKNFPDEIKTAKIAHLESKIYRSEKDMSPIICLWTDKKTNRPVIIVSTRYHCLNPRDERRNRSIEQVRRSNDKTYCSECI